jgi:hypothetical protein
MLETILFIVLFTTLIWSAWIDTVWLALVGLVIFGIGSYFTGTVTWELVSSVGPFTYVLLPILSLSIGTCWSFWKWRRHMRSEHVQKRLRDRKDQHDRKYREIAFRDSSLFPDEAKASKQVSRIISWIMLWPFSMLVYLLEDVLTDLGRWIYNRFAVVYVRITESALPEDMR